MTGGRAAPAAFAALVAAIGAWVGLQAAAIPEAGGYSPVGPRFFPAIVSAALVAVGLALLWRAWRGAPAAGPTEHAPAGTMSNGALAPAAPGASSDEVEPASALPAAAPHRAALAWLSAAMLSGALLVERAGFVTAMALAFWLASRAFTGRVGQTPLRDATVAVAVALAVRLFFAQVLGLRLPAGPLGL